MECLEERRVLDAVAVQVNGTGSENYDGLTSVGPNIAAVGDTLYFRADSPTYGSELWRTQGDTASTKVIRGAFGASFSHPSNLTATTDGKLFFVAQDLWDRELWVISALGEFPQKIDIRSGAEGSLPENLTAVGHWLYFSADGGDGAGRELWRSDGTILGTKRVGNIARLAYSSNPSDLTEAGGKLFFTAYDDGTGLYVVNSPASDITPSPELLKATWLVYPQAFGGEFFFYSQGGIWKSDGGAPQLAVSDRPRFDAPVSAPTAAGDRLYFVVPDDYHSKFQILVSNGTDAGTTILREFTKCPNSLTAVGDDIYFSATEAETGAELWFSNGTSVGTYRVKDIIPGPKGSRPQELTAMGDTLYFTATDDDDNAVIPNQFYGRELWASRGTVATTDLVVDLYPLDWDLFGHPNNSNPQNLIDVNGTLYFTADDGNGRRLWKLTAPDNVAPIAMSFVRQTPATSPTNADTLVFRATFSEAVANVDTGDFAVNGSSTATVSNVVVVSGSNGMQYDVTVLGGNLAGFNGTVGLNLKAGQNIADLAGTPLPTTEPAINETYTLDNGAPGVTSFARQTPATGPTNADTLVFRATFSEAVVNVDTGDFAVNGSTTATVTNVAAVSASQYDVTISGGNLSSFNGMIGLNLKSGQNIADLAGNALPTIEPATDQTYTLDNVAPNTTSFLRQIPATSPTNADTLVFRATFSEAVVNVDTGDFAVNGSTTATVTNVAAVSASQYDVTISGGNLASFNGTVGLNLKSGQNIADLVGNALPTVEPTTDQTYTLDNVAPSTTSFLRQIPATSPTNADTLVFRATFSEAVVNVDTGDFAVNGSTTATVTNVTVVSALQYDVTISGGDLPSFNGTVGLNLKVGQNIADLAGNALPTIEPATDQTYTLDNVVVNAPPTLNAIGNLTLNEDAPAQTVNLTGITAGPAESQALQVTASSSNIGLIPNPTLTYISPQSTGSLSFTPVPDQSGTAIITVTVRDAGLDGTLGNADDATFSRSFTVTVNPVNDAPVLDNSGTMVLNSIAANDSGNAGTLVTALLASAGGDRVTDVDSDAVEGIAIIALDASHGTWQFSLNNGSTWSDVGNTSLAAARLLAADANTRLRFRPATDYVGTVNPAVTFRAWDRTTGSNGGSSDVSVFGGTSAFSAAIETASIQVTDLTAPTATIEPVAPDPRNTAVGTVTINFSEPVTGVNIADFVLTRDGSAVSLAGLTVQGSGAVYTIDLSSVTATSGMYVLTLRASGSGIQDAEGNALTGDASDSWTVDAAGLAVVATSPVLTGTLSPFSTIDVTFNKPIAPASFDTRDVGLLDLDNLNISPLASFGGAFYDATTVGVLLYAATGGGLQIFDISDPAAVTRMGGYETSDAAYGVQVEGNLAYLASGAAGLYILDISNPDAVTRVGGYDTSGTAYDVQAVGNVAYVADGAAGMEVVDVSNPAAPVRLSGYDTSGSAKGVRIVGNRAYVADRSSGLQILNVANPAAVTFLGGYDTTGSAQAVDVVGDWAYIADDSKGLQILNVANPAAVTFLGGYDTSGNALAVDVIGDRAYVADDTGGVLILDVSNPAAITALGGYASSRAKDVQVVDSRAYVCDEFRGLHILDVSSPATVARLGGYASGWAHDVKVLGNSAYTSGWGTGLQVFDVSDVGDLRRLGSYVLGNAINLHVVGNLAYVASEYSGLHILDASDPGAVTRLGGYSTSEATYGVRVVGHVAYVADTAGLKILDVSNPGAVAPLGGYDPYASGNPYDVEIVGNRAYVASVVSFLGGVGGLDILDVSNPAAVIPLGAYRPLNNAYDVQVVGDLAYVASSSSGLQILDVSNPAAISRLGGYDTLGVAYGVHVVGNLAYIADGSAGLLILDVTNPADVRRVAGYDTPGIATGVQVVNGLAYIADRSGGLIVLQVGSPVANISHVAGNTYRIDLGRTLAQGEYALQLGPEILDLAGLAMDQNQDGQPREGSEDMYFARFTIDSLPTVSDVSSPKPDGTYGVGEVIDVTVQFSDAVIVTGTPTLMLETGMIDRAASYVSGSGSQTLTFRYTVQAGDHSSDLDYTGTAALSLAGSTIKNSVGNDATLALPAPGAVGSLGANKGLNIDTTPPAAPTDLDLADADDTGSSNTDNLTKKTSGLTISGAGETGATVQLFDDADGNGLVDAGEWLGTTTVGNGTFTLDISLLAGTHSVKAIQTDSAGNVSPASAALTIIVDTISPQVTVTSLSTDDTTPTITGTVSDGTLQVAVHGTTYMAGDGNLTVTGTNWTLQIPATDTLAVGTYDVSASAIDTAGNTGSDGTTNELVITAAQAGLRVTSFSPTSTGFVAQFSLELDVNALNLYDTQTAGLGPADVVVQGVSGGVVAGAVVIDALHRKITFIRTGDPLDADTYTVTLRSAADGFKSTAGDLLDGDGNGTPGDNYTTTFTVASRPANAIVVSLPDFVRGPGQPVNVPATSVGLPLNLSNGAGVKAVDLQIGYNPALLEITGATVSAVAPAGASVVLNTLTPGLAILSFYSTTALPAGNVTFVNLQATVPSANANAIYTTKHLLDLQAVTISDGNDNEFPVIDDDALHVCAYVGDVSGNGRINASDASLVARVAALLDPGFAASQLADPIVTGDVSGNGRINASDASQVAQAAALLPVSAIPAIPPGVVTSPITGGPDPKLNLSKTLTAVQGTSVTVPVQIDSLGDLQSPHRLAGASLVILFDKNVLTASGVTAGSFLSGHPGWSITSNIDNTLGRIVVVAYTTSPVAGTFLDSLVNLEFTVGAGASGSTAINLAASSGATFTELVDESDNSLPLEGPPTNGSNDAVDGLLTIIPSDPAGITVTPMDGGTTVSETGTTDTYTLVLTSQPTANVVITVAPDSQLTVSPGSLTFTAANWNIPQVVTVTAIDDSVVEGPHSGQITHAAASSDATYHEIAIVPITAQITDNDAAGFTLSKSAVAVLEANTTDTFTVVLTKQPLTDVVFTLVASDLSEATVSPASLTFTSANWNVAQPVTVTAADDVTVDGAVTSTVTVSVNDASSDNAWDNLADQTVTVTTNDNDVPGFTLSKTAVTVTEPNGADTFTVVLTKQPLTDVVFTLVASDLSEATVSPASLTFTSANWNVAQPVTIAAADDVTVDGAVTSTVTVSVNDASSDNAWDALTDKTVTVTTNDDDVPGFMLSETAITVTEPNGADTFTVVLTKQPLTDVVFTLVASDLSEATVSPASLTFTSANWNVAQAVTVTAADDVTVDGAVTSTVTVSVNDASSDNAWDNLADQTVMVTTNDDDVPGFMLSKTAVTVTEPSGADTFTVVLTKQPLTDVVFTLVASDLSEATVSPASLTFTSANWNVAQPVTVTAADDVTVDGAVTSTVTVSVNDASSDNAWDNLADQTVAVTTNDNSITLAIAATNAEKPEGNLGTTAFTFTVTRSGDASVATTVDYAVTGSGPNAADAADFGGALPSGKLTFAIGETSQVITVDVSGDTVVEPDEGFTVTLSNASNPATITTATAAGTILNDDSITLAIAATDAEKPEGNSGTTPFTFTVTRSGDTSVATTVDYSVTGSGANAANAADFGGALPSGTVTFAVGETSQVITIDVSGDTAVEPDEGFTVTLSDASSPATITTAAASGTILNDDSITLAIAATDAEKPEGNSGTTLFTFAVTRSGDASVATTVDYAVTGSGANPANAADFGGVLPSGLVTFGVGETSQVITIDVSGDTVVEPDEGLTVTLGNASSPATITIAAAAGTILNDDSITLAVAPTDAEKPEGNSGHTPFIFTVTRSGDTSVATTVDYAVTGSGTNPANAADFGGVLPSGTVTFAIGETSQMITVDVSGDTAVEPDKGFSVTLSNASSPATITTAAASGTILNDDAITLAIAATDAEKLEGNSGTTPFTFTVTRSGDTSVLTTVDFTITGSGANPANAADFGAALPFGTLTFAIGETSQVITIDVSGDTAVEPDEGFTVTLSNASSPATITTAAASGTILNDDSIALAIAATDAEKPEGNSGNTSYTFTVTRSGDTSVTTTVVYAVTGGGANPADAADFAGGALSSGALTFNAGETSRTITVEVAGDTTFEADEAFTVTLSNASNAQIVSATAAGTILNDDLAARLTLEVQELDSVPGLTTGETFLVLGRWADLSQAGPRSIYAGYADISFDPAFLRVESIEYSSEYPFARTGNIDQDAGLVDEVGAISGDISAPPDNDQVFVLRVTALASGSTTIASAAGQGSSSEVVFYGDEQDRRLSTEFGSLTVQIAAAPTWHNAALPWDVDGSGTVTPLDVLELINYLNSLDGGTSLPSLPLVSPRYYDVNGDGQCSPLDVLMVINHINTSLLIGGESEIGGVPHGYAVEEPISMDSRISALNPFGADTTQGNKLDSVFQNSLTQADPLRGVWPHAPVDLMEAEDSPLERTASREQEDELLDALLEKTTDSWLAESIDAVFADDLWR
jgi:ELWxxDGT repeat protein